MPVLLLLAGLCMMLLPTGGNPPIVPLLPHPHCLEYGTCKHYPPPNHHHHPPHNPFVPAPPGKTPACAKHGQTFCEKPDRYPMHLIRYLVDHWLYDYRSLLSDESRNDFPVKPKSLKPTYGPPPPHYGPYPPPLYPPAHQVTENSINLTQPEGYPDRRYPLPSLPIFSDDPGFIYSAILQPDVTPYDPSHWWKRYARSERSKRQAPGQDVQLCPTRSQFVTPRAALNMQGNWMFVVNLEQDQNSFTQQVRSETCISNECNGICSLPNGYTSRCQQQYVQKRLVALQGSGNQLYTDIFWLPHCCICQISLTNGG